MVDALPTWAEIIKMAPITAIILGVAFAGWYLRGKDKDDHIKTLRDWIDHLKK